MPSCVEIEREIMRDWCLDLFDPGTAVMDSLNSSPTAEPDFGFAFNDSNFSDRLLLIEIVADPPPARPDSQGCSTPAARKSKRRRGDDEKEHDALDISNCAEEHILQQADGGDGTGDVNHAEQLQLIKGSSLGDEAANDYLNLMGEDSRVLRVKSFHVSSAILAAKSPFFFRLFSNFMMESEQMDISNDMMESEQRHVTLRISESEEAALMELLNFMYSGTLNINTAPALLDMLMAADKFEVASCIRYCSRLLRSMPMGTDNALLYLDLPSRVVMADAVQPLTDAAKQFLATRYKDITKSQDELMTMPLSGIEAILSSDDLQVASEDVVYDFVLKWARSRYPNLEERREILSSCLGRYVRFPFMTVRKLKKLLTCNDFDHDFATKYVLDALFFKADPPHRHRTHPIEESTSMGCRFKERAYKYRPVKEVVFESPRRQCIVYLDLKREECEKLFPDGRLYSQAFHLGGEGFFLSAHCNLDQQNLFECFGLFLGMQERGSIAFTIEYEFAVRSKPTEEFISKYKGNYTFTGGKAVGYRNLFSIPWTSFVANDSLYFINDVLHLRAELTMKNF